jgi:hypothetical protein
MHGLSQAKSFPLDTPSAYGVQAASRYMTIDPIHERKAYRGINGHKCLIFESVSN